MIADFKDSLKQYKAKCDLFLSGEGIKNFLSTFELDREMGTYIDALIRHSDGGKRIRAYLVCLGYGLFSGDFNMEKTLLPSMSYELFQTGILAHDDIIDNSDYRRFAPSMHKDLGHGHDGVSKSICVGDLGIVSAIEILTKCDFSDEIKLRAISHQNKIFAATIAGELKDIEFSYADRVEEEDIIDMYRLKTAGYTVTGPLVLGAILACAKQEHICLLQKFGDNVGIAFQIRDDILGMFGDENKLGKSAYSDMCEGKKTIIVSHFDRNASDADKDEFYSVYGMSNSGGNELAKAQKLLIDNGSLKYAEDKCEMYIENAKAYLSEMSISDESRSVLLGLLTYMTQRNN